MSIKISEIGIIADPLNNEAMVFKNEIIEELKLPDLNKNPEVTKKIKTIIVIGGDGFLLHTVHQFLSFDVQFYGVNYGHLGFLLNEKCPISNLMQNIEEADLINLKLLKATMETEKKTYTSYAMNEVSLFRETGQVAKIKIYIDGILRMEELVSDGVVLSTAAGSTAYNFSLHGPIFSPEANVLSLCPVSPFRPRHWRGALLLESSHIKFEILESKKRPVLATADFHHFEKVKSLTAFLCDKKFVKLLFNRHRPLKEKILAEQFLI